MRPDRGHTSVRAHVDGTSMIDPNLQDVAKQLLEASSKQLSPPSLADREVALRWVREARKQFDSQWTAVPPAEGVSVRPLHGTPVPGEAYSCADGSLARKILLYHHGGGQVFGSASSHRHLVTRLAKAANVTAWSMDYPLAPESPHPAGMEAGVATYRHLLDSGVTAQDIVVAGDSGGATLTMAMILALKARGEPLPAGIFLISPFLDFSMSHESHVHLRDKEPWVNERILRFCAEAVAGGTDYREPLLSPLNGDLGGLPPVLIHVGTNEVLLGDALQFASKAAMSGSEITLHVYAAMFHAWHLFHAVLTHAAPTAIREAGAWIADRLTRPA